jgi:hypothetical protein
MNNTKIKTAAIVSGAIIFIALLVGIDTSRSNSSNGTSQTSESQTSESQTSKSNPPDLDANVSKNMEGITIVNNEYSSWSGCVIGVNGGCGWDFSDPPYKTYKQYTIAGGQSLTVPYGFMSNKDGLRFDITTHVVNSVVVMCSMGTDDPIDRILCGTF